ncbi:MAG: phage terminase large subunit family protein [Patescibacteria group bacterium]
MRRNNQRLYFALYHHRNLQNQSLDFESNPFLAGIYKDNSQEIIIKKAAQIGISEWLICDDFANAEKGLRIFHVLPTIDLRNIFAKDRIDNVIYRVPYYLSISKRKNESAKEKVAVIDNVGLKSFGNGVILLVGSNSPVSFLSFPADVVVIDELDACDQDNIAKTDTRLGASTHKLKRKVSNPSIDNYGIDLEWQISDQKNWQVKCEHCGEWQELDFFRNVVNQIGDNNWVLLDKDWTENCENDVRIFCAFCKKELNRLARGEWVANYPKRKISGYHCSQLFFSKITIAELWKFYSQAIFNQSKLQQFYNFNLGLCYTKSGDKLTEVILDKCIADYIMPSTSVDCTMGVDVGSVLHIVISDYPEGFEKPRRKVFVGTVPDFNDLDLLIKRFEVKTCVIDGSYDGRRAKIFRDKFKDIVWLCEYHRSNVLDDLRVNEEEKIIKIDRTQSLDQMVADIFDKQDLFPKNASSLDDGDFYKQLCVPTRILELESNPPRHLWTKGVDHYFHANNYDRIARRMIVEYSGKSFIELL